MNILTLAHRLNNRPVGALGLTKLQREEILVISLGRNNPKLGLLVYDKEIKYSFKDSYVLVNTLKI